jgi:hypothetical protein
MTPEDAPRSVAVTFFSPPREPETHGFVKGQPSTQTSTLSFVPTQSILRLGWASVPE